MPFNLYQDTQNIIQNHLSLPFSYFFKVHKSPEWGILLLEALSGHQSNSLHLLTCHLLTPPIKCNTPAQTSRFISKSAKN